MLKDFHSKNKELLNTSRIGNILSRSYELVTCTLDGPLQELNMVIYYAGNIDKSCKHIRSSSYAFHFSPSRGVLWPAEWTHCCSLIFGSGISGRQNKRREFD